VVAFWRGDWPQAVEWSEKGARQASAFWASPQRGFLLLVHAFLGNRDETYAQLDELNDALPRAGRANLVGAWNLASFAAEAIGVVGDRERARILYGLVIEALATGVVLRQVDGRVVETSAAMAAAIAGLWDEAEAHFESALRRAEELPHLIERPYARDSYARFLFARGGRGDRQRAHGLLMEAVEGFHARGMLRHESRAQQLLSGLTDRTDVQ
jgi:tetratricopeptide (TPR) repeat protein